MTKQITPAHVRRAIEQERARGVTRSPPRSALKQILAALPVKQLDLAFMRRRRTVRT